jgi:hypothetical protein
MYMNPNKNLIEPKPYMNPTKNLIELSKIGLGRSRENLSASTFVFHLSVPLQI